VPSKKDAVVGLASAECSMRILRNYRNSFSRRMYTNNTSGRCPSRSGPIRGLILKRSSLPGTNVGESKLLDKLGMKVLIAAALLVASVSPGAAKTIRMVGATTFTSEVMVPHQAEIEAASGQNIMLLPNRSNLGIYGLFEGNQIAMMSSSLDNMIDGLRNARPDLDYDRLRVFNISKTRVAFSVHRSNLVSYADLKTVGRILTGEMTNWRQLGGSNLPITVVLVQEGGGVQTSVEAQLGIKISVKDPIRVQISSQVNKVVEQLPEALGLSQIENLRESAAVELTTDRAIGQELNLVTLGEPSAPVLSVIEAVKRIATSKGLRSSLETH
jgi:ABC-type phosphate transport system substrate-binding protein